MITTPRDGHNSGGQQSGASTFHRITLQGVAIRSMYSIRISYTSYEHMYGFPNKRSRHQSTAWIHIQTDRDGAPMFRCPECNGHGCRRPDHLKARCAQYVERDLRLGRDSIITAVAVERGGARGSNDSCAVALLDESGNRFIAALDNWFSPLGGDGELFQLTRCNYASPQGK